MWSFFLCDSIIGTLLNIKGKTKDYINSFKDLVEMGVRLELKPQMVMNIFASNTSYFVKS